MIDINKVEAEAKKELADERFKSVKDRLVAKYKELDTARTVVRNIEEEIEEIKANAAVR